MIPFPKTEYNDIIANLNFIDEHFDIDDFRFNLKEYKRKGIDLIKKDPETGLTLLGIVSCVEQDLDQMHSYHKSAIEVSGGSFFAISQYGCSLYSAGLLEEAWDFGLKAYNINPTSKEILSFLVKNSYILGKTDYYRKFKEELIHLKFDFIDPDSFPEDDEKVLSGMIETVDTIMMKRPDLIIEQDPDFEALVDELVDGVDV